MAIARSLVLGRDVDDTIGIDIERDFDLGNTFEGRRNANQIEITQECVPDELTFTLVDLDLDGCLAISSCREYLQLLRRDSCVAVYGLGHDTAKGLVTSRRSIPLTFPARTPPWIAAPIATASSGLTPLLGSRPKMLLTVSATASYHQQE